jgi:hypothetical protein
MVKAIFDSKLGLLKEAVIWMMMEKGIDLHPFFYSLSSQPAYFVFASACEERG